MKVTDKIEITNEDNMALMSRYPDKYFDLAIVDPPYGIDINMNMGRKKGKKKKHDNKCWDKAIPSDDYFRELFRVSKNQIVWGGNYFPCLWINACRHFIFWDKMTANGLSFSDGEMAWTSFDRAIRKYTQRSNRNDSIHPTQKPVALYKWLLDKYAKQGDKILDTHLGSGSIAIACHDYGFELTACELDGDYYDAAIKRILGHISQQRLF